MASGENPGEGAPTTGSTTREKFSAFKNRAATQYTRVKQVLIVILNEIKLFLRV